MNSLFLQAAQATGTLENLYTISMNQVAQWKGHIFKVLTTLSLEMQKNQTAAVIVFATSNLFLLFTLDRLAQQIKNGTNEEELTKSRLFKHILVDGCLVGGGAAAFNALISKITEYQLDNKTIALITAAFISTRLIIKMSSAALTQAESSISSEEEVEEQNSPEDSKKQTLLPNEDNVDPNDKQELTTPKNVEQEKDEAKHEKSIDKSAEKKQDSIKKKSATQEETAPQSKIKDLQKNINLAGLQPQQAVTVGKINQTIQDDLSEKENSQTDAENDSESIPDLHSPRLDSTAAKDKAALQRAKKNPPTKTKSTRKEVVKTPVESLVVKNKLPAEAPIKEEEPVVEPEENNTYPATPPSEKAEVQVNVKPLSATQEKEVIKAIVKEEVEKSIQRKEGEKLQKAVVDLLAAAKLQEDADIQKEKEKEAAANLVEAAKKIDSDSNKTIKFNPIHTNGVHENKDEPSSFDNPLYAFSTPPGQLSSAFIVAITPTTQKIIKNKTTEQNFNAISSMTDRNEKKEVVKEIVKKSFDNFKTTIDKSYTERQEEIIVSTVANKYLKPGTDLTVQKGFFYGLMNWSKNNNLLVNNEKSFVDTANFSDKE